MSATATQTPPGVACLHCGGNRIRTTWQRFQGGKKHLRADCCGCGKFVKFLRQQRPDPSTVSPVQRLAFRLQDVAGLAGRLLGQLRAGRGPRGAGLDRLMADVNAVAERLQLLFEQMGHTP